MEIYKIHKYQTQGYHGKLNLAIFAWRFTWNYAYSQGKELLIFIKLQEIVKPGRLSWTTFLQLDLVHKRSGSTV